MLATLGGRAFQASAPHLWNELPLQLRILNLWNFLRNQLRHFFLGNFLGSGHMHEFYIVI